MTYGDFESRIKNIIAYKPLGTLISVPKTSSDSIVGSIALPLVPIQPLRSKRSNY